MGYKLAEIVEYELLLGPDVVRRNVRNASYEGYVNPDINDDNYPVSGEGVVKIKYRVILGEEIQRTNGWIYRDDFKVYCRRERGLREPNAAEATLPYAKDNQLGRGNHPTVAFIRGSCAEFLVIENDHKRNLRLFFDDDGWDPRYKFLAVCE